MYSEGFFDSFEGRLDLKSFLLEAAIIILLPPLCFGFEGGHRPPPLCAKTFERDLKPISDETASPKIQGMHRATIPPPTSNSSARPSLLVENTISLFRLFFSLPPQSPVTVLYACICVQQVALGNVASERR